MFFSLIFHTPSASLWQGQKLIRLKVMFPNEEDKPRTVKKRPPLFNKKLLIIYGAVVVTCLSVIAILLVVTGTLGGSSVVTIPDTIKTKFKSAIYLPNTLPGNYKIDESSFTLAEEDTVLVFNATDSANSKLIFSEQAKPKDFDFNNFHKGQFEDVKTISGVSYPSFWGKSVDGRMALSVITDDTWIIMVTSSPLGQDDMALVAKGIHRP